MKKSCVAFGSSLLMAASLIGCAEEPEDSSSALGDSGEDVAAARGYLERYGYLSSEKAGVRVADDDVERALRRFQERFRLPVDGTLNEETRQLMARPRCGHPDEGAGGGVGANFEAIDRWSSGTLSYSHTNYTPDLSSGAVESAVANAFSQWSGAVTSGLSITKVSSGGDIQVSFATGDHGDGYPFDGAYGVLAHAFYPTYGGDIHFDDAETWVTSGGGGYNFLSVALHEAGHALGLGHSYVTGAVMQPYYSGLTSLQDDDILGIKALYEPLVGSPPSAPAYVSVSSHYCYGYNDVSWPAVSGATSYQLQASPVSNFAWGGMVYAGPYTVATINVDNPYWYVRARACNAGGCSGYTAGAIAYFQQGDCL